MPDTPAVERAENHHTLVEQAVKMVVEEDKKVGGQLGRPSGARYRTFKRLDDYVRSAKGTVLQGIVSDSEVLKKTIQDIYRFPLKATANETLNRQLKAGIEDDDLAELVIALREEDRLCVVEGEAQKQEAQIICSLGLIAPAPGA